MCKVEGCVRRNVKTANAIKPLLSCANSIVNNMRYRYRNACMQWAKREELIIKLYGAADHGIIA